MATSGDVANAENRCGFEVEVEWVGIDKEEHTREDLAKIYEMRLLNS